MDLQGEPGLDHEYLERQRDVMPWARYRSDVLGEWADDDAAMFGHDLLMDAAADFEPVSPQDVSGLAVVCGLDYGFIHDASGHAVVGALPDLGLNEDEDRIRLIVPHVELHRSDGMTGMEFVRRVASPAQGDLGGSGFAYRYVASEANGVGEMPTQELLRALQGRRALRYRLTQTAETKAAAFGRIRSLLEDRRLILPRGELIRALGSITARITESGSLSIEATRQGGSHADLASALAAAMGPRQKDGRSRCKISAYDGQPWRLRREELPRVGDLGEIVETGAGIRLPARPLLADLGGPLPRSARVGGAARRDPRRPPRPHGARAVSDGRDDRAPPGRVARPQVARRGLDRRQDPGPAQLRPGEFGTPKSRRSARSVPLADRVAGELERLFQASAFQGDNDLVFCHPQTGRPYDPSKVRKRFKSALRRAKVREARFHDLRHTFGTRMAATGVSMRTLQEWLGHRDFKTTLIYADYMPDAGEKDLVERAFEGGSARDDQTRVEAAADSPTRGL